MSRSSGGARMPLVVGVALAMIALAVAYPFLITRSGYGPNAHCLSNVKQCDIGMLMYNADFDDRYPDRDRWMDLTLPYTKNVDLYRCPFVLPPRKELYGYAFNSWLAPQKVTSLAAPSTVPLLYDSINYAKNASDPFLSFPGWPTGKEKPRRNLGFADGGARYEGPTFTGWKP